MEDEVIKAYLHDKLRAARSALLWKLEGLSEYDVRRPLTPTGTNLLGLVKHKATSDSRYLGEVFGRPFPEPLPRWDDRRALGTDHWATEHETRDDIVELYLRVGDHTDATIEELALDDSGYVPWWQEEVPLFNIIVHVLNETNRHAGHADVLREGLDGAVGFSPDSAPLHGRDGAFWAARRATVEAAAVAAAERARGR